MFNIIRALCAIFFFGLLTACGGGGGSASAPTSPNSNPPAPPTVLLPAPNAPNSETNWRDAEFRVNWGLGRINADAAYQRRYWGQGATVAVVDSGVRASHNNFFGPVVRAGRNVNVGRILTNAARRFDENGNASTNGALDDPDGHGTGVAAVIAGTYNSVSDPLGHGVAPLANILPLRLGDSEGNLAGDERAAFRYAMDNNVHIINNSHGLFYDYYGHLTGSRTATTAFRGPVSPQFLQIPGIGDGFRRVINDYANTFRGRDVAVVWSAGNQGWNTENGAITVYSVPNYGYEDFIGNRPVLGTVLTGFRVSGVHAVVVRNGQSFEIDALQPNRVGIQASVPLYHPELRGRWLAVVATDSSNRIASFSNGCGSQAKYWCLAAPGVGINTAGSDHDNDLRRRSGTSFSAPHVSGALALLKSRLPDMPMPVLVHILLTTATDLGADGVDDVYGHGLVNIARAITLQGNIRLPSASAQGVLLQNANTEVPASFAGFAERLNGIGVAAEYLDGFYYDAPLGGMIRAKHSTQPPLNFAAGLFDMDKTTNEDGVFSFSQNGALRAAGWQKGAFQFRHNFHNKPSLWQNESGEFGDITRRPFFADDGGHSDEILLSLGDNFQLFAARGEEQKAEYSQMGISWRRQFSSFPRLQIAAAHSHIAEDNTLLGGKFGGVMPLTDGGYIRQTDIGGSYALDGRWRIFGNYQRADIGAKFGGIVGDMSGVVAEGWRGGFAAKDYLKKGDTFRIAIGKETTLSRGEVLLRINQSSNPQKDESTQAMHNRGYRQAEKRISLAEATSPFFAIGYAFPPRRQFAVGNSRNPPPPHPLSPVNKLALEFLTTKTPARE